MQTPIDFGKEFLNKYFDEKDVDGCLSMLAGDLVWITPEDMHHFLSEGAVLKFLQRSIEEDNESRYVDLISIKSSPSADNIMTVAYEVNLVSREDERPLYLRCSMAICRRSRKLEITFLHFSRKTERDSSEQLRGFVSNLPCGVMILACLDGQREEAVFYNDYFARRLRYGEEEFARAMAQNPFFMTSEEDREEIRDQIGQARKTGGNIAANLRFFRRDGNSFYYRMIGAPAYQADGGTVYYCVFQETTGFRLTNDRLQSRLDTASGILRQIPEAICGIEYPPQTGGPAAETAGDAAGDPAQDSAGPDAVRVRQGRTAGKGPRVFFISRNIPAMFGVSNSAYSKNILLDPFYGLEITSITRERLLENPVFGKMKGASAGPLSCGIFRLRGGNGTGGGTLKGSRAGDPAVKPAEATQEGLRQVQREDGVSPGVPEAVSARRRVPEPGGEMPRVELVVRRVREKNGTVKMYLFYYDREAQQKDLEQRIDRAMKMGRAGQDQLRADLRRAKEGAARRQSEMQASMKAAQEKHEVEITRAENRLLEEKNRAVLLARQLEEARAARRQMSEELEEVKADADRRILAGKADADRQVKEAGTARDLLEEQLREAQERSRRLESRLRSERTRRLLLEEQFREVRAAAGNQTAGAPEGGLMTTADGFASAFADKGGGQASETAGDLSGPDRKGSSPFTSEASGAEPAVDPARDWMAGSGSLTVFSSIDPESAGNAAAGSLTRLSQIEPDSADLADQLSAGRAAAGVLPGFSPAGQTSPHTVESPLLPGLSGETADEERAFLAEKQIRAREQEKAQRRLRRIMDRAAKPGEDLSEMLEDFLTAASSGRVLLQEQSFSPAACLENILRYEDFACTEKEITLRLYRDSRLPDTARGFGALLVRALCELLENAIASTRRGGLISVHCRADRPSGGLVNVHFRIDDSGAGISPSRIQTIFEVKREAGTDRPIHSGLFAAREAARLMGGSVHARSGPGGSRFTLSIALRVQDSAGDSAVPAAGQHLNIQGRPEGERISR